MDAMIRKAELGGDDKRKEEETKEEDAATAEEGVETIEEGEIQEPAKGLEVHAAQDQGGICNEPMGKAQYNVSLQKQARLLPRARGSGHSSGTLVRRDRTWTSEQCSPG